MSASKNEFEEALVFAEDLISMFFKKNGVFLPKRSTRHQQYIRRQFNEDMLSVTFFFSQLPTKLYYAKSYFPRGYTSLDFLHYCGKIAFQALCDFMNGMVEAGDHAIHAIDSCLQEFMRSGEFERNGGWFELKELASKLCWWHVFNSVVCIGNKYGDFVADGIDENAFTGLQTAAPEESSNILS